MVYKIDVSLYAEFALFTNEQKDERQRRNKSLIAALLFAT
jgi:hypothetical protein